MAELITAPGVTIINYQIIDSHLHCGLITVDRFTPMDVEIFDIKSAARIEVRLPSSLARQPVMTSLANQKIQIIQRNS
jgi:hypothetical protein